jgi:hypothetical protein
MVRDGFWPVRKILNSHPRGKIPPAERRGPDSRPGTGSQASFRRHADAARPGRTDRSQRSFTLCGRGAHPGVCGPVSIRLPEGIREAGSECKVLWQTALRPIRPAAAQTIRRGENGRIDGVESSPAARGLPGKMPRPPAAKAADQGRDGKPGQAVTCA